MPQTTPLDPRETACVLLIPSVAIEAVRLEHSHSLARSARGRVGARGGRIEAMEYVLTRRWGRFACAKEHVSRRKGDEERRGIGRARDSVRDGLRVWRR
mmetsp:Transcript_6161/g.12811  ORF Transcript_6161/g.12811 Transcript_6161/m.12811 type:complete len:99 (+) Transcript_6161:246-542(+)